jgi:hypothetical protein
MSRIGMRRAAGAAVLVALAGLVSACGGDDAGEKAGEKIAEKALEDAGTAGADVDIDGDNVTIESDEGTVKVGTGDVPESFPSDLSIPDGDITASVDSPQGAMLTIDVEDPAAAFDEAVADLEANGWTRVMVTDAEGTKMAQYSKGTDSATLLADEASGQLTYTIGSA